MTSVKHVAKARKKRRRRKTGRSIPRLKPECKAPLRFTPYAWAKLLFLRDYGDTEVGGFGITSADDWLLVEDIGLVRQRCTAVTVKLDDAAVADFFDDQVDQGRQPQQFARMWIHSHPADSAQPSGVDEETFARCFGGADWAVMFVLAKSGQTFARLQFNVGPGGSLQIPVVTDFSHPFPAADHSSWEKEYLEAVQEVHELLPGGCFDDLGFWEDGFADSIPESGFVEVQSPFFDEGIDRLLSEASNDGKS